MGMGRDKHKRVYLLQICRLFVERCRKRLRKAGLRRADDAVKDVDRKPHGQPCVLSHLLHAVDELSGYAFGRQRWVVG